MSFDRFLRALEDELGSSVMSMKLKNSKDGGHHIVMLRIMQKSIYFCVLGSNGRLAETQMYEESFEDHVRKIHV